MPIPTREEIFDHALDSAGKSYRISRALASHFPGKAVLETSDATFDLDEYARAKKCVVTASDHLHGEVLHHWDDGVHEETTTAIRAVDWNGMKLLVATARWIEQYREHKMAWIIADDDATAKGFFSELCAYCNVPRGAVLAFNGGCWSHSRELYDAVQSASFDDLVLAGDLKEEIRDDFASFLSARSDYEQYGVPWKRGVLFIGPPGNGKTHCLRATLRFLDVPILYVQSLKSRYETDDNNIRRVFDRARAILPSCLVFEDLDAMLNNENRSYFLNQLDGFAKNPGVLTIATTNHPERLDPAILERPSRFDRKYHFELPKDSERRTYLSRWNDKLDPKMRITDAEVEALVADTEHFSFAYLQELYLSAMVRWIKTRKDGAMHTQLRAQLDTLRSQMRSTQPTKTARETTKTTLASVGDRLMSAVSQIAGQDRE